MKKIRLIDDAGRLINAGLTWNEVALRVALVLEGETLTSGTMLVREVRVGSVEVVVQCSLALPDKPDEVVVKAEVTAIVTDPQ